ncbi:porin family protein [Enterovibrio makurazakiensis]|uniref:outer membrane beta-barrel protein n=1 Tax=Enterovibrio makurazakiensis TaxID=2910232 RepID=UPI003D1BB386
MKNSIVALLLLSSFSFGVFANPFVGVTVGTGKIEDSGFVDTSYETSYSAQAGYDMHLTDLLSVSVFGEYKYHGEFEIGTMATSDLITYSVNIMPKLYVIDTFYIGTKAGLGKGDVQLKSINGQTLQNITGDNVVVGLEAGYIVDNFTFKAGLEESNVKYKGEKISAPAGYVGVNYTF